MGEERIIFIQKLTSFCFDMIPLLANMKLINLFLNLPITARNVLGIKKDVVKEEEIKLRREFRDVEALQE